MSALRFDGKVAVVTGAGSGLGREYALLFASRGAKVVVNDLGGNFHGEGSSKQADVVVAEIKALGGEAVPNYNSVTDGEQIIKTAIEAYGRIDILVNNAGILRDKSFGNMSDNEWNAIYDVHLKGAYVTTRAAWPYFRKQKYGRVVMTSSNSGVYGNFGQANYSAAKLGLVGLANTLAIEGAKYNIHCNVIVPTAASRMTEGILPEIFFKELKPKLIAPVVVYLCHEECDDNGSIIESAAGWATKLHIVRGKGSFLRTSIESDVSPEYVRDAWSKVTDMTQAARFESNAEATGHLANILEELQQMKGKNSSQDGGYSDIFKFTSKDLILYALGVGACVRREGDLRYLYENYDGFGPLPTYFIQPGLMITLTSDIVGKALKKDIDLSQVFHGEQFLEVLGPLPTEGELKTNAYVADVLDKRSGAVIIVNAETSDLAGNPIVRTQSSVFVVGAGNFGGKKDSDKLIATVAEPKSKPDATIEIKTSVNAAALFRLSGDLNPMHIDPGFSMIAGHKIPIMHGLCTMGLSVKAILAKYAGNQANLLKAVKARFSKPVIPGQTLLVHTWRTGTRIIFKTSVLETGADVLVGGYVDLRSVVENKTAAKKLESDAVFDGMQAKIDAKLEQVKKINGVFLYRILDNGAVAKEWTLDLKNGKIHEGKLDRVKIDTTLSVEDKTLMEIATGKLNPQAAFMKGKLKITGNIMLTQKLLPLLKEEGIGANKTSGTTLQSDAIFNGIQDKINAQPEKAKSVNGVFLYKILHDGKVVKEWTLDLKNGKIHKGHAKDIKIDTTLTVADSDLVEIATGKLNPQSAFMKGKLKITGNIMLTQKLVPLLKNEAKL
ncbi:peroxisomal multifunctional enzyme type 2 [Culicoides brevitarsis]|uniref:peroxisomal multifunctional enzyme type 2 n=1 Tax=Culicoides brevitarsis TaxID=469753 RepID=UPI00307C7D45